MKNAPMYMSTFDVDMFEKSTLLNICILLKLWSCIYDYIWIPGPPRPFASVSQLPQAVFVPENSTSLDIWNMHVVHFVILCDLRAPGKNLNMGHTLKWLFQQDGHRNSVQKDVLHCSHVFCLSLSSFVIPECIEPWPQCRLELILDLQPTEDLSWN